MSFVFFFSFFAVYFVCFVICATFFSFLVTSEFCPLDLSTKRKKKFLFSMHKQKMNTTNGNEYRETREMIFVCK